MKKSTRIKILLLVDSIFFLLEIFVGYAVHSLALVADSFHMLNDILSLLIAAWAVNVASQESSPKFTYGWQRAETLGALVNGVFLVALCLSIFLEAIQRFVEPQIVSNPVLVLVVGCFGLLSNVLGLFLFHDHGHSHGHSHDATSQAEEGGSREVADERGNIEDVLPENVVRRSATMLSGAYTKNDEQDSTAAASPLSTYAGSRRHYRHSSSSRRGLVTLTDDNIHPASFRNGIIAASRLEEVGDGDLSDAENEGPVPEPPTEDSPLLAGALPKHGRMRSQGSLHANHRHNAAPAEGKRGHSHGDLNMRGVFLHVLGDALGNIGVIGSALFIWLTPFWWRYYSDPLVSLIITVIILASAIPLCKAASRILLQAVPAGIDVDDIKQDIKELPGILDCHHVHVWQLSDTKLVSSLHIEVSFDFKGEGSARYMELARAVRGCLHAYGIHSSTIQPEFNLDPARSSLQEGGDGGGGPSAGSRASGGSKNGSRSGSVRGEPSACLLECGDECGGERQCCTPAAMEGDVRGDSH
ncbi:MAG: hypothetical protein M1832_006316 [Thelocarpon impressellum]|nr:MAG: hypothetical protein M1832_006316 [Thelocarpon impressellum]